MVPFFHVGVTLSWKCAAALHASVVEGLSCAHAHFINTPGCHCAVSEMTGNTPSRRLVSTGRTIAASYEQPNEVACAGECDSSPINNTATSP